MFILHWVKVMDNVYLLNIERAVLSSVLFDCTIFDDLNSTLQAKDFYLPAHQKVYDCMAKLHSEDMPIDEEFIRTRVSQKDVSDSVLIEILSANPISNVMAYSNEIKQGSTKRELAHLATEIKKLTLEDNKDNDVIIENIIDKIELIKKQSHAQNVTLNFMEYLNKKGGYVTLEFLEEVENTKMLFDGFLPSQQITTIVGEPNVGKSALALALANHLLETKQIDVLMYFDIDSPLPYTKDRIQKLISKHGKEKILFYHGSTTTKESVLDRLRFLATLRDQGLRVLMVMDSLKDFVAGSITGDEGINEIFDILKAVRDTFGATIIALHHTKKNKSDDGKLEYIGSQAIKASSDSMQYVSKLGDGKILTVNDKMRAMLNEKMAFDLDFEEMQLSATDIPAEDEVVENGNILEKMELGKNYTMKELSANFETLKGLREAGEIGSRKDANLGWVYYKVGVSNEPVVTTYDAEIPDIF